MKHHLNTLFVTTQGAYLSRDGDGLQVKVDGESKLRLPIINLGGVVCFGRVSASPALMGLCAKRGVSFSYLTEHGQFLAQVVGYTPGNVHLRREQYRWADDGAQTLGIARRMVIAKIANARTVLLRAVRDYPAAPMRSVIEQAAYRMALDGRLATETTTLDGLRGIEGESAGTYFSVFDGLITTQRDSFSFVTRSRRPPLDRINALLSFLYTLMTHDARAACEASGLDAAVGFLHRDRSGRPGLALDLIEEFRAFLADRLALSLINRQQIRATDFKVLESGAVILTDSGRRTVLTAYQERKQETLKHPFLGESTTVGLLLHLQARLLARYVRGDIDAYPPFVWR